MKLLFMLFIYPLEYVMEVVLEGFLALFGSPSLSLFFLSLSVTILSFPISHIAEKLQNREKAIQKKLNPKILEFKGVFKGAALNTYIQTLYRQNNYHPIYAVRSSFGLLIQIPFFFAAYHFISNYSAFSGVGEIFIEDLGKPDGLLKIGSLSINVLPFIMTAANMISAFIYGKKQTFKENLQLYGISLIFLVALYNSPSALLVYWTFNNVFSFIKNIFYRKFQLQTRVEKAPETDKTVYRLFIFSMLALGTLIFFTCPATLLASGSASDIDGTFSQFLYFQLMLFTVFLTLSFLLFYYLPEKLKKILSAVFSVLLIYALTNAFIFPGDYGDISNFYFENGIRVKNGIIYSNILIFIAIIVSVSSIFYFKKTKYLIHLILIVFTSLVFMTLNEGMDFYKKAEKNHGATASEIKKKFIFSKNKKNVLIIMPDRFIGGYIPKIFELFPEFNKTLDGFTWFSNSLSSGSDTLSSEPSIMGGWDYHADDVNKTRTDVPLLEKMDESIRVLPYNFTKAGFQSSIYARLSSWMDYGNSEYLENTPVDNLTGKYVKIWLNQKNKEMEKNDSIEKLAVFGLFRISPPFLRESIYDNGKWLLYEKGKKSKVFRNNFYAFFTEKNKSLKRRYFNNRSTLDYLPELSDVSSDVKPQFFYFSTKLTHEPWLTNNDLSTSFDGKIEYPVDVYNELKKSFNSVKHLYTDAAALKLFGEWFEWMKANGVYDNTRIIIISDHGRRVHNPFFKKKVIPESKKKNTPAFWHNVFLVKDFNSHGELKTDKKLMVTCDVPYLALKGIINGENPYTGNPIVEKKDKLPLIISRTKFRMKEQEKYKFNITESFKITDEDIFNLSNWKRVDQ